MNTDSTRAPKDISIADGWLKVRGFDTFPTDRMTESMRSAKILDFSGNRFSSLPDELGSLFTQARVIFLSGTKMPTLPAGLASCVGLEMVGARGSALEKIDTAHLPASIKVLTLTDNTIAQIPADIARLPLLEKLCISGNRLTELPEELADCSNLEMLRVASNQIVTEPAFLHRLPQLKWYNDAGNVFSVSSEATDIAEIANSRLRLTKEIGKSANNRVFRAMLDDTEAVAVKVYGSVLSTDGTVADEIAALCAASGIAGVVGARGITTIAGQSAVVMPLVNEEYSQLAAPPDLRAYTRDRYSDTRTFSSPEADLLIGTLNQTVRTLHDKGIAHGDIYAHNLLYRTDGEVLLNDFGAASLFAGDGDVRQAIDLRALEVLTQEIRDRVR